MENHPYLKKDLAGDEISLFFVESEVILEDPAKDLAIPLEISVFHAALQLEISENEEIMGFRNIRVLQIENFHFDPKRLLMMLLFLDNYLLLFEINIFFFQKKKSS